jgi:uncharacterized membrane protein
MTATKSWSPPSARPMPAPRRRAEDRPRLDPLVRGLGWFSLALGAAELVAPQAVANLIGMRRAKKPAVIRMFGLREMAGGIGILTSADPTPWLWARVAGDVMDLAALGSVKDEAKGGRLLSSVLAVAGVTALDVYSSRRSGDGDGMVDWEDSKAIEVRKTVTIARPPAEIYAFWRNLENLPRFMTYLESVRVLEDGRSAWKAKGPAGSQYEWTAEITEDRAGELISWRSLPPSDAFNTGTVAFLPAPGDRGTEVHVTLRYEPPAGALGAAIAKLFGKEPGQQVMSDLRRLKQVLETGEVMNSDASIADGAHPAQPGALRGARS